MARLYRHYSLLIVLAFAGLSANATIFSTIHGAVHDPTHRPVAGSEVILKAQTSQYQRTTRTGGDGAFEFSSVPAGEYVVQVRQEGFAKQQQPLTAVSGTAPVMHFQLKLEQQATTVVIESSPDAVNPTSMTPTTTVDREEINRTPGAGLSNSLNMVTNYIPGAYMTHDQLHIRGGHQVTWAIDGVPIPNTNIASNVGPQIDPKDIDVLEVQRGGYSSEYGDRTYGLLNVLPRTGFERNGQLEVNTTYGSFHQSNDQINFGNHTERLAYFGSVNGNRSDYGLETPGPDIVHDRVWGLGGFGSVIFNPNPANQLRFVTSVRRDDYQIPIDPSDSSTSLRDVERERDLVSTFSWVHTFSPGLILTTSPFFHFNRANYDGDPSDTPIQTIQHLDSAYAGAQISLNAVTESHNARFGVYGFGQHDNEFVRLVANDGSGADVMAAKPSTGHLEAAFLEDQFRLTHWLTLTGGARLTHFSGTVSENAADPRLGAALRIPRLNWVIRGFYGRYYQAPPLSTVSGPLLGFAVDQGLGIIPLKGERDEENQVGIAIPLRGWTFDVNSFRQRARNYFDHNSIGDSNVFFPLSISGARIRGQEFTVRSPRLLHRGQASIAYSYQHAKGQGTVAGGLTDFSPPPDGYFLLDHDQRHTLHGNLQWTLPHRTWASGAVYYGSGFTDGSSDIPKHLDPHTTFDLSIGKSIGENLTISLNGLNIANRRFLLDNSETFGGTHYAEPRQIFLQLRYAFRL
jgi:outer membrane receptor protein involved in Fe transport